MEDQAQAELSRSTRWKRVITITGPSDWVQRTRNTSLAQGIHQVGTIDGIPCLIEVVAEDIESLRYMSGPTPNSSMVALRTSNPAGYEEIHGPGTAREHADYDEIADTKDGQPTTRDGAHFGQYL